MGLQAGADRPHRAKWAYIAGTCPRTACICPRADRDAFRIRNPAESRRFRQDPDKFFAEREIRNTHHRPALPVVIPAVAHIRIVPGHFDERRRPIHNKSPRRFALIEDRRRIARRVRTGHVQCIDSVRRKTHFRHPYVRFSGTAARSISVPCFGAFIFCSSFRGLQQLPRTGLRAGSADSDRSLIEIPLANDYPRGPLPVKILPVPHLIIVIAHRHLRTFRIDREPISAPASAFRPISGVILRSDTHHNITALPLSAGRDLDPAAVSEFRLSLRIRVGRRLLAGKESCGSHCSAIDLDVVTHFMKPGCP